jgi:hypothetical protein
MLTVCRVCDGGISYSHVRDFVSANWKTLCPSADVAFPAYIQLDHVYGLEGRELNLSTPWAPQPSSTNEYFAVSDFSCNSSMGSPEISRSQNHNNDVLSCSPTSIAVFPGSPVRTHTHSFTGSKNSGDSLSSDNKKISISYGGVTLPGGEDDATTLLSSDSSSLLREPEEDAVQKHEDPVPPASPFGMLTASFRRMLLQYTR